MVTITFVCWDRSNMNIPTWQNLVTDWSPPNGLNHFFGQPHLRFYSDQINKHYMPWHFKKYFPLHTWKCCPLHICCYLLLSFRLILHRSHPSPTQKVKNSSLGHCKTTVPSQNCCVLPCPLLFFPLLFCLRNVSRWQSFQSLQILYFMSSLFQHCSWSIFQEGDLPVCTFCT